MVKGKKTDSKSNRSISASATNKDNLLPTSMAPPIRRMNSKSINAEQFLPHYQGQKEEGRPIRTFYPTTSSIYAYYFKYFYERDEAANRLVEMVKGDVFNPWFDVKSEDEELAESIKEANKKFRVKNVFGRSFRLSWIYGWSLIVYNFEDNTKYMTDPVDISDIHGLKSIKAWSPEYIMDINRNENFNSNSFGDILSYTIYRESVTAGDYLKVPAERFLHIEREGCNDDGKGQSIYLGLFNTLLDKEKVNWSESETYYQCASPLKWLGLPDDADETERQAAQNVWLNLNTKTMMVGPQVYDPKIIPMNTGMDASGVYQTILTRMGIGSGIGKQFLAGDPSGAIAAAKETRLSYQSYINNIQTEVVEYYLREFYDLLQEIGEIKQSESSYEIIWNPIYPADQGELAEIKRRMASTAHLTATALVNMSNAGMTFQIHDHDVYAVPPDSNIGIVIPGISGSEMKELNAIKNALKITKAERMKIREHWAFKTERVEPNFNNDLQSAIVNYQNKFTEWFKDLWETEVQQLDFSQLSENDITDLIEEVIEYRAETKEIRDVLSQYIEESYLEGWEETEDAFLASLDESTPIVDMPEVRDYIIITAPPLTKDISDDLNDKALRTIAEGVRAGESYKAINDRIIKKYEKYNLNIPKTVHRVVHEAMMASRMDAMEKKGEDQVDWITAGDDRVRPEHQLLEAASPILISLARQYEGDWACRCAVAPVSVLVKIRSEGGMG